MSGAPLLDQMRSLQQRRQTSSGDPSSVRERWRSRTSPSTLSQWLSESRERPKASSETGGWRSERGCVGREGWRRCFISVWILVEGYSSVSFHLCNLPAVSCVQSGRWFVYMHRGTWIEALIGALIKGTLNTCNGLLLEQSNCKKIGRATVFIPMFWLYRLQNKRCHPSRQAGCRRPYVAARFRLISGWALNCCYCLLALVLSFPH